MFNQKTAYLFHIYFLHFTGLLLANCDKSSSLEVQANGGSRYYISLQNVTGHGRRIHHL